MRADHPAGLPAVKQQKQTEQEVRATIVKDSAMW